jgi:hypothetical protein
MRVGNNYSGARWAFSERPRRTSKQGWRYFGAAEVAIPPIGARLAPNGAVVLRCFACDWGYTVDREVAPQVAREHAEEH